MSLEDFFAPNHAKKLNANPGKMPLWDGFTDGVLKDLADEGLFAPGEMKFTTFRDLNKQQDQVWIDAPLHDLPGVRLIYLHTPSPSEGMKSLNLYLSASINAFDGPIPEGKIYQPPSKQSDEKEILLLPRRSTQSSLEIKTLITPTEQICLALDKPTVTSQLFTAMQNAKLLSSSASTFTTEETDWWGRKSSIVRGITTADPKDLGVISRFTAQALCVEKYHGGWGWANHRVRVNPSLVLAP
jgi:hypothetical protein